MPFDVEKEAGDWIAKWIDGPDLDPEDVVDVFEHLKKLLTRCQDTTEGECIRGACIYCERELLLRRNPKPGGPRSGTVPERFWYKHYKEDDPDFTVYCSSSRIHERRRRREQG